LIIRFLPFLQPAAAQFGVGGNRKKGSSFQELNEEAKQVQDGGMPGADEIAKLQQMYGSAGAAGMDDKQMEEAMEMLMNMSPEALEQQMQDAMKMLTEGDMLATMMEHSDEILKTMEETQAVPPEELARFRSDPAYFKEKMAESFDQMKDIFNDPEIMKAATESMGAMAQLMKNPEMVNDLMKELQADFSSDDQIEKARLELLAGADDLPSALKDEFESVEMQALLSDPKKWRESVKEGAGMLGGASVGEL
jgi:hypothetical protein